MTDSMQEEWPLVEPHTDVTLALILNEIDELDVKEVDRTLRIASLTHFYCRTEAKMRCLLGFIHTKSLFDSRFSIHALEVITATSNMEVGGNLFINAFIDLLLGDFSRYEEVLTRSHIEFMGMVALVAQAFSMLKIDNQPIHRLVAVHITYQKRLLDIETTGALQLSVIMLIQNGGRLKLSLSADDQMLKELIDKITARLMATTEDNLTRSWLMVGHNLAMQAFKPRPRFYKAYKDDIPIEGIKQMRRAIQASGTKLPANILSNGTYKELLKIGNDSHPEYMVTQPRARARNDGRRFLSGPGGRALTYRRGTHLASRRRNSNPVNLATQSETEAPSNGRGFPSGRAMTYGRGIHLASMGNNGNPVNLATQPETEALSNGRGFPSGRAMTYGRGIHLATMANNGNPVNLATQPETEALSNGRGFPSGRAMTYGRGIHLASMANNGNPVNLATQPETEALSNGRGFPSGRAMTYGRGIHLASMGNNGNPVNLSTQPGTGAPSNGRGYLSGRAMTRGRGIQLATRGGGDLRTLYRFYTAEYTGNEHNYPYH